MLIVERNLEQVKGFCIKDWDKETQKYKSENILEYDNRNHVIAQMIMGYEYDLEPENLKNVYYIEVDESRERNAFPIESITQEKELEYRYQILDCYLYDHFPDYYFGVDDLDEELAELITRHKEERNLEWNEVGFLFEAYRINHEYFIDMCIDEYGEKTTLFAAIYEEM